MDALTSISSARASVPHDPSPSSSTKGAKEPGGVTIGADRDPTTSVDFYSYIKAVAQFRLALTLVLIHTFRRQYTITKIPRLGLPRATS